MLFSQPYPQSENPVRNAVAAGLAGVFVFLFLWFFQPFGISAWDAPHKSWYLAGYGLVTAVVVGFDLVVLKWLFPRFFAEANWTVGKAIGWTLFILLSVAVGNYLFGILFNINCFDWEDFGDTLLTTVSVGIFPSVFIPLSNYIYQLRKYSAPVTLPSPTEKPSENTARPPEIIELVAENGKDRLTVALPDLLFIESSDNYSTVFFLKNGKIAKELIRGSLSRLEGQIAAPDVMRCHRSYIVNLAKVRSVSGNAQGYKFHLEDTETPVPVARKYSHIVKRLTFIV